jgi:hypothetical protein
MGTHDHHRALAIAHTLFNGSFALVIPNLSDAFFGENLHHLPVVNKRTIGIHGATTRAGILTGNVDCSFDTPEKTS